MENERYVLKYTAPDLFIANGVDDVSPPTPVQA
jgi:hypothetical protein